MLFGRRTASGRFAFLMIASAAACNALVGIEDPVVVEPPAESCVLNSHCDDPMHVCLFETCSPPCDEDVDCARGEYCLATADGSACVSTGRASCGEEDVCPLGTACFDGECRTDCRSNPSVCLGGQVCDADGACRGPGGGGTGGTSGNGGSSGSAGTSGPGGEGGSDGGGGSGGSVTPGDPCSDEGALKCVGRASTGRLVCEDGFWAAADPCAAGELCDGESDPPGSCAVVPEECQGRTPGAGFCDGLTRVVCGVDLVTVERSTCPTLQHCSLATGPGCAVCLPNEYRCSGEVLEVCSDARSEFEEVERCTTEPCNAEAGACTSFACLNTGDRRCMGDRLEECNDERSGFDLVETCDPGLCDPAALECDRCVAGEATCANTSTRRLCSADGQTETEPACPAGAPRCTGAGVCVECAVAGDCEPTNDCYLPACNTGTGKCEFIFRGENTECNGGYCTSSGACVECTLADHCDTTTPCTTAVCRNNACGTDPFDFTGDPDNCGACGTICSSNHVTGRDCTNSTCVGSCQSGWADCNTSLQSDGCETNIAGDVNNCSACGRVCSTNHVSNRACSSSTCTGSCTAPWLNCDGNLGSNGCETDSANDPANCGACNSACTYGYCASQTCAFTRRGTYGPGPNSENRGANTLQGFQITISVATTLKAIGIRTGSILGTPHVRLALYRDSGGAPQALVAQTGELTAVLNGVTEGMVTATPVAAGNYWIFFVTDATLRIQTQAITGTWWTRTNHAYAAFPQTLPGLTGATVAEGNLYVVTTP